MGFTTYVCADCGDSYVSSYTEILPHNYIAAVTDPTCLEMGYTVYTCPDCGDTYTGDYTDPLGHDYGAVITAPTCETMGFTTYTCKRDGSSYVGDYTDVLPHNYTAEVTAPTCTAMGYTVYTCPVCGDTYTGDYTDPLGHDYQAVVTDPTCTEMGYTVFTCKRDGTAYTDDYTDALGHTPSGWIIDIPATLDAAGSKHIECTVCGEVLKTAVIPQLKAEDYTDNNGEANVGGYIVIVTDKNAAPVPHSRVTIDAPDNIGVELPDGRLLDYADQTTVTALYAELRDSLSRSVPGLTITVSDPNGNFAMGITDDNGQIVVPASATDTGNNGNGTIGGGDGESQNTYVVTVTDKDGGMIDNCAVSIGEGGSITVDLPENTPFDRDNPVTVTVTDQNGTPQQGLDVTVQVGDLSENGTTNALGKVTLPPTDRGYTNDDGVVKVNGYIVIAENTENPIARAFVTDAGDGGITVLLPEPYILTAETQTTVTVLLAEDESPVRNVRVTVFDYQNRNATDLTNLHGKITVPPLDRGYTDEGGIVRVDGYIVKVEDTTAPITGAFVTHTADDKITVLLPDTHSLNADNQTTVTVILAADETPVKGLNITVSDANAKTAAKTTNAEGKITVPDKPSSGGSTGGGGSSGGSSGGSRSSYIAPTPAPVTHSAYVTGYPGGDFRPESSMTRAEAAAVFARLLAEKNGDTIRARYSFPDIAEAEWYAGYVAYLKNYGIIMGYPNGTFGADNTITRAEFTAMSVRFYAAYTGKALTKTNGRLLKDVQSSYWAAADIQAATANGWIVGYPDGTFRGEADITRAEVVAIVNRVLGRRADTAYIDKNLSALVRFKDVSVKHWAYYDIMEAANAHNIKSGAAAETWQK
jgi:transposase-like protein